MEAIAPAGRGPAALPAGPALERLLLLASFGTAVASFVYEIDWLRMLALVLGSATHSFELMLSAFIFGLAAGALAVRTRADRLRDPVRALGIVQWLMGALALATLALYTASFGWVETMLEAFAETDAGYAGFTVARYGLCLAIMLPATFCAGMTLPLITRILVAGGVGERAIGAVYSWNTLGSIVGVILGGLLLLPLLGLKGMLLAGALLDMAIGVALLARRPPLAWAAGVATAAVAAVALAAPALDPVLLTSGVFRNGESTPADRRMAFYADGRTSTVTAYRDADLRVLSTNGKPDASLTPAWFDGCAAGDEAREPLEGDDATQALLPLVTLAHAPAARTAAVIGQGSGMSSHLLLASPALEELVTVEIEPEMMAGSRFFYPANRRAFDDPRSRVVIDDAKSYFASSARRYDLVMSEPSNPWVSGVSGLFTTEFYARVRQYLGAGGVFGQWLHMYELDDELVLSVLAAIHRNFPSYEIYLVPRGDLLVVAGNRPVLPAPDWSVAGLPALGRDLCRFVRPTPATLGSLHLVGRRELAPLLDGYAPANSDFFPVLDLGAERRRFRDDYATGFSALSSEWFNLLASLTGRRSAPGGEPLPAFPQNPRLRARAVTAHVREPRPGTVALSTMPTALKRAEYQLEAWRARLASGRAPASWRMWLEQAEAVRQLRAGGAAGWDDAELYAAVTGFLDRHDAPEVAKDVVRFRHAVATWSFARAAEIGSRLAARVDGDFDWIDVDELRDGAVLAALHAGDAAGARRLLDGLDEFAERSAGDLRSRLLGAYVAAAERGDGETLFGRQMSSRVP